MRIKLDHCIHKDSVDVILRRYRGGGMYDVALPLKESLTYMTYEKGQYCSKEDHILASIDIDQIRELYDSLGEELMRLGIIPRPMLQGEVAMLKEQLADAMRVRDHSLDIVKICATSIQKIGERNEG
jgi:hypothetical protein